MDPGHRARADVRGRARARGARAIGLDAGALDRVRVLGRGGVRADRIDRVRRSDADRAAREGHRLHQHRPVDARPLRRRRHAVAARLPRAGDARRAALRRQRLGLRPLARGRVAAPAGRAPPARRRTASRWSWPRSAAAPTSSRSRISSACRRCRWSSTSRAATARTTRTTTRGSTSSGTSIPGFAVSQTLARVLGLTVMRLASADVLPFRYSHYARKMRGVHRRRRRLGGRRHGPPPGRARSGRGAAPRRRRRRRRAAAIEAALDRRVERRRSRPGSRAAAERRARRLEQQLLDESEPPATRWYRHVIYGWNIYSLYEGQPLPGLAEAIRARRRALRSPAKRRASNRRSARFAAALEEIARLADTLDDASTPRARQRVPINGTLRLTCRGWRRTGRGPDCAIVRVAVPRRPAAAQERAQPGCAEDGWGCPATDSP